MLRQQHATGRSVVASRQGLEGRRQVRRVAVPFGHARHVASGVLLLASLTLATGAGAQVSRQVAPSPPLKPGDSKPYDEKLLRLSEILGAVHYLRELCGQSDRQEWRDKMRQIMEADGGSALRRAMLARSFNNGYRSYGRTYQSCTPTAQTAIGRFLAEGAQLADGLVKSVP